MRAHEVACHLVVALGGLHSLGSHGVVRHEEQCSGGDAVGKATSEECGRLHVHGHGAGGAQIALELVVVLPHPAVGGEYGSRPVVEAHVAHGGRHGTLEHEGWQGRHLGREVVVARTLAPDAGNGQYQVASLALGCQSSALAQKEACLGAYGGEKVHDDGGIGASHAKVYYGQVACRGHAHVGRVVGFLQREVLAEDVHVVVEVGQQDVLAKVLQRVVGVSGQPVFYYFLLGFHGFYITLRLRP